MKLKNKTIILIAVSVFNLLFQVGVGEAFQDYDDCYGDWCSGCTNYSRDYWISQGYSCTPVVIGCDCWCNTFSCSKNVVTGQKTTFSASKIDYRTLRGKSSLQNITSYLNLSRNLESPFIYFTGIPKRNVSLSLSSKLDKYYPKPDFNIKNGWVFKSGDDNKIYLDGRLRDNLFYELAVDRVVLSRSGVNFSSKSGLVEYLLNSDFLERLNFSDDQKKNSLDYFLPKLSEVDDKNFYYLTILSDNSIDGISQMNINPRPENLQRRYFAVYPTDVEVMSTGNFVFPEIQDESTSFTIKETGEFLIQPDVQVFFEE